MRFELQGTSLITSKTERSILIDASTKSRSMIESCEHCNPVGAEIPFDWILADVLDKRGPFEFVMSESARCPNCRAELTEKTLVEPHGGIEVEAHA